MSLRRKIVKPSFSVKDAYQNTSECACRFTTAIGQPKNSPSNPKYVRKVVFGCSVDDQLDSNLILKQDPTNCESQKAPSPLLSLVPFLRIELFGVLITSLLNFQAAMGKATVLI